MNQPTNSHPPKWPLKLLRFLIKDDYLEEIEGDMEEHFHDNVEQLSLRRARRLYTWDMLKLLRPGLLKNPLGIRLVNPSSMFRSYVKISVRNLMKTPLSSFINIVGLSVAIGVCIFGYGFARWVYGTDQFHTHKHEVFLATFLANRDGSVQEYGRTPRPLGERLRQDFAHIRKVCRIDDRNVVVKQGSNVFPERVRYTDPAFLAMFTFPLKWGTPASLSDVNNIILSEPMSIKYFGEANPIGQRMLVKFDKDRSKVFTVSGVAEAFPQARTIDFNFLINFENFRVSEPDYNFQDWKAFVNATLIQVDDPANISVIEQGIDQYRRLQNKAVQKDWAISSFAFEPLATLHERSEFIRDDISRSSKDNYASVVFMVIIGVFMLVLACFNYINIAVASAAKRLKEIGVRKSIGASRTIVIVQFLTENIVITTFALLLGLLLGVTVIIPWFEAINHFSMGFTLNDARLWLFLPTVLLLTGIASGAYPAFYISKFQVVRILQGSVQFGRKNPLTKTLLGIQLVLACIFITSAVMFTQNSTYLAHRSWGYDQKEALYAEVPDESAFAQLDALMAQNPNVLAIAGSDHHLGKSKTTAVLHRPDRDYEVDQLSTDAHYFETMGLHLKAGRTFNEPYGSDKQAIVVNELLAKNLGLKNPIGQIVEIDSTNYQIIGIVRDFHSNNFFNPVRPTIFRVADKADYRYLSLRVRPGSELETYRDLQQKWAKLYPETPFQGGFQEDVWGGYFNQIEIHGRVWRALAILAVLLAGLGLYGLMTLNVAGRVREFSIRKVLGASLKHIAITITEQYLLLFAIALIVGAPISYSLLSFVFDIAYTYHMPMNYSGVVIAITVLLLVLLITTSTQVRKVLKSDPVKGLKVE